MTKMNYQRKFKAIFEIYKEIQIQSYNFDDIDKEVG